MRRRDPVARLVAIEPQRTGRVFAAMRGRAKVDERFFERLLDQEIDTL